MIKRLKNENKSDLKYQLHTRNSRTNLSLIVFFTYVGKKNALKRKTDKNKPYLNLTTSLSISHTLFLSHRHTQAHTHFEIKKREKR